MTIKFTGPTRHGTHTFPPGVALAFEDPGAEEYFCKADFAKESSAEPTFTYPVGSVVIDPETVRADNSKRVLGDA